MEEKQYESSMAVKSWIKFKLYTKIEIAEMIGITRPTLDDRIKTGFWRKKEINIILKEN
jgi:predicted XRE-type DNA-binding protein